MMSVSTTLPAGAERRIRIPGMSFKAYETWVQALPERSPVRMAFDGRSLEIMVKGPVHEDFRGLLGRFAEDVAGELGIPAIGLGETTWKRPELERGLEADQCYFFTATKIEAVNEALASRTNDVAGYPNPDLAIEVDISPSEVDRPGIYAALRVPEVWTFDGELVTIWRLGSGGRYSEAQESGWLPVRADEVARWVVGEDTRDRAAWARRLREWIRAELSGRPRPGA
jgi:Uma2 family endonuclease